MSKGFTLIEIMVVVGIMAVVMAISIPFAYHALHRDAFNQTLRDIEEIFANARAQAILQGSMAEVIIHGGDFSISAPQASAGQSPVSLDPTLVNSKQSGRAVLVPSINIVALRVNGVEYAPNPVGGDEARVRFFPNGTCDEMRLVLYNADNGEKRGVFLEITTGLASIESDPNKLMREIR